MNGKSGFQFQPFEEYELLDELEAGEFQYFDRETSYELTGEVNPSRLPTIRIPKPNISRPQPSVSSGRLPGTPGLNTSGQSGGPTFTRNDVIDERIDVFAQYSLLRMFKGDAAARGDGEGMLAAVKAGQLAGIYKEDERVPAMRARNMNMGWWQLIPKGEDAALIGHPGNLPNGTPIIVFRDSIRSTPPRIDPALRKAWRSFLLLKTGGTKCNSSKPETAALGRESFGAPLSNVVPRVSCQLPSGSGRDIVAFANGYVNPHVGDETQEVAAVQDGLWEPSNPDFESIATNSNAPLRVATDSLQTLLNVINAELPGAIKRLFLVGHANARTFSFSGQIRIENRRGKRESVVTFTLARAITVTNLKDPATTSFIDRNNLSDRFAPGGEIILFGCKAGAGSPLMDELSRAFKVCVRGFKKEICVFLAHRKNRITGRGKMKYDTSGTRACTALRNVPFTNQLESFVPDVGPACVGVVGSSAVRRQIFV
jgi:hypothetical protein